MIGLNRQFKSDFEHYFTAHHPLKVPEIMAKDMELVSDKYEKPELINTAINVAKTCDVLNLNYSYYYEELATRIVNDFPEELNPDLFIFEVAFLYFFNNYPEELNRALGTSFVVRNIYKEVAEKSGITVEQLKDISTEHSYSIQLPTPESWDKYFHDVCLSVGANSKCHSRKIGAVLTRNKRIIATGYNGPPSGIPTCDQRWYIDKGFIDKYGENAKGKKTAGICPRRVIGFPSGEGLDICPAGHAERNALIASARFGIDTDGTVMYMSCGVPCTPCLVEIINAGVEEVVCSAMHIYDEAAMYLLENSKLKIRLFDFLT